MALPVGLSTVTVSCGPYTDARGVAYTGTITFTPTGTDGPVVWADTGAVILDGPNTVTLDAAGSASITLPATDATGLSVADFTYTVVHTLKSTGGDKAQILPILIQLPQAAPTVDLDVLEGMTSAEGVTVGVPSVTSVGGLSGVVTVAALKTALGLGTAAYVATTAFDAAGAATAAQAAAITAAGHRSAALAFVFGG